MFDRFGYCEKYGVTDNLDQYMLNGFIVKLEDNDIEDAQEFLKERLFEFIQSGEIGKVNKIYSRLVKRNNIYGYCELDADEKEIVDAYLDNIDSSIDDVRDILDNPIIFVPCKERSFGGEDRDDYDLGWAEVESIGIESLGREVLENYFDYESFGRDLRLSDYSVAETESGDLVAFWNY